MSLYLLISNDEYIYLVHIILDILGSQSPENIQNVLMQGIYVSGQFMRLTRLAEIPQE